MKKLHFGRLCRSLLAFILSLALLPICTPVYATRAVLSLSAHSALLMDAHSGEVLYQSNAHQQLGMASTTKLMTALTVLTLLPLDKQVAIPREAVNVEGSSVYLTEGELLSVEQLLYALLLASANDAAAALAIAASGSIDAFAGEMNAKAGELGLCNTHFTNPHGLFHSEHYTTAYELALIARAVLESPVLRQIASTYKATIPQGITPDAPDGAGQRYLVNHNKLLKNYKGAIGLKTGFTKATGRCLVSAAERDGLTLIAVTLNAPDDWRDHTAMLDHGFSNFVRTTLYGVGEFRCSFPIACGAEAYATLTNTEPLCLTLPRHSINITERVTAYCRFVPAPIESGRHIATLTLSNGRESTSSPLVSAYAVAPMKK